MAGQLRTFFTGADDTGFEPAAKRRRRPRSER